jgi:hypothetical protein
MTRDTMPQNTEESAGSKRLPAKELRKITRDHILAGIAAFKRGDAHTFADSDDYDLIIGEARLPPKAVLGLAALEPLGRVLTPDDFSGGLSSTCFRILEGAGFKIATKDLMLVLVTNDTVKDSQWGWEDELGVRYHFPNRYRNMILPGRRFIYYRGVLKADGSRRETPEYFGCGMIGEVIRDDRIAADQPKTEWQWFAQVEDFQLYRVPVPWRDTEGKLYEEIAKNLFQLGVRKLSRETYERIQRLGGIQMEGEAPTSAPSSVDPDVSPIIPSVGEQELQPAPQSTLRIRVPSESEGNVSKATRSAWRRHHRAVAIGRRGEQLVWDLMEKHTDKCGWTDLDWPAKRGETPGWDIGFMSKGQQYGVEVKSTTLGMFADVDITTNEWQTAQRLGDRYWLALVTEVEAKRPKIVWIRNPAKLAQEGTLLVLPQLFSLSLQRVIAPDQITIIHS